MELENVLEQNPSWKILSKAKLVATLRATGNRVSFKTINEYFKKNVLAQIFKQPRAPKHQFFKINALPYSYQIDIVKMTPYKSANKGIEQFLLLVDILSRKAFAYILPSGRMEDVMTKYKIFVQGHDAEKKMVGVSGDDYFSSSQFTKYNQDRKFKVFTSVAKDNHAMRGGNKLGIIDRLVRTLKMYMEKRMASSDDPVWTGFLDEIIDLYNSTPHSTLRTDERPIRCLTPNDAYEDKEFLYSFMTENKIYNEGLARKLNKDLLGTKVRIALPRQLFQKEGQGYSKEIYTVVGPDHCGLLVKDDKGNTKKVMARECQKVEVDTAPLTNAKVVATRKRSRATDIVTRQEGVKVASNKDVASKKSVAKGVKPRVSKGFDQNWFKGDGQVAQKPVLRDRTLNNKIPYWMR